MRLLLFISLLAASFSVNGTFARAQNSSLFSHHDRLWINDCVADHPRVERFKRVELAVDLKATYDNPFDPEQIDLYAIFTSPAGKDLRVNGFLYQDYRRELLDGKHERLNPIGNPVWKIRFAPEAVGTWRYRCYAVDRSGTVTSQEFILLVTAGSDPGNIGVSKKSPGMFAFPSANNRPFFAIGENMCWSGEAGTFDFDTWLKQLSTAGGNWIRIWMNNGSTTFESMPEKGANETVTTGYHGLGRYALDHAWRVDRILDEAEKNGIYSMLCLGTYGEFNTGGYFNEGQWPINPYNAANGGPCVKPDDFWTSPTAAKIYQRRLRYIAARYGYRTHLHSWEFWNEANLPAQWVAKMADFLKGTGSFNGSPADPFRHLVSTTYGTDEIWRLPGVDFTMTHSYGTGNIPDHAPVVYDDAQQHRKYSKPHLMAEFGIDWRTEDRQYDPAGLGINLHNGIWAGIASGDAGGAMIWYWDNYVAPLKVYRPFVAARKFADKIAWSQAPWSPLKFDPATVPGTPETFSNLTLPAGAGWGKSPTTRYTIGPQGLVDHAAISQFLYSPSKPELRTVPEFRVNYSRPGSFTIHVDTVSGSSRLKFAVDGVVVKDLTLNATPPPDSSQLKPEYESTVFVKEYSVYQAKFNKDLGINVPSGPHTITIDNSDGDWASITGITLSNYRSSRYPDINLYGISNGTEAILWAQNAKHNWKSVAEHRDIPVITGAVSAFRGLPAGRYTLEWWNTTTGEITGRREVVSRGTSSVIPVILPNITDDIAARIYRPEVNRTSTRLRAYAISLRPRSETDR